MSLRNPPRLAVGGCQLSILQRQVGKDYSNLSIRMASYSISDFVVSTVTFHEQILGIHAYINRAQKQKDIVKGYEMIMRLFSDFKVMRIGILRDIAKRDVTRSQKSVYYKYLHSFNLDYKDLI